MPLSGYLSLLRPEGKLIIVGAPEKGLPNVQPFQLILNNIYLGGSIIVSSAPISSLPSRTRPLTPALIDLFRAPPR